MRHETVFTPTSQVLFCLRCFNSPGDPKGRPHNITAEKGKNLFHGHSLSQDPQEIMIRSTLNYLNAHHCYIVTYAP